MTKLLTATLFLSLVTSSAWLSRHVWLVNPSAYQASSTVLAKFGQAALTASRPELITIASHAKLGNHNQSQYNIRGQLYNPLNVPLTAPTIVFTQVDRDNRQLNQQHYPASSWLLGNSNGNTIPAQGFVDFVLPVKDWPASSWGYQISLIDPS